MKTFHYLIQILFDLKYSFRHVSNKSCKNAPFSFALSVWPSVTICEPPKIFSQYLILAVLEIGRFMPVYHTGNSFCSWISYRHLSVFIYYIHLLFFSPFFWRYFLISLLRNRPITVILNLHFQHWILDSVTKICRYIQTYLSSVSMVLDDRAIKVRSRQTQRIFPPAPVSRPVLKPTQPPLQWVQSVLSPGLKRGRGVTLTTHNHIVPRSWMSRSYK
jgi:hypothetical protein